FALREASGPRQVVSAAAVNDDQWHHVVLSAAINTQTMYLDGKRVGDLAGFVDHGQQGELTLGAGRGAGWPATNGGDFYFGGAIDEVALYLHPLGSLAVSQHFGSRPAIDELTGITLPQDDRRFAKLTYDDVNDRVRTLVDAVGRTWTLDTPTVLDSTMSARLRGPSSQGDWTSTFNLDAGGRTTAVEHRGHTRTYEYNTAGFPSAFVDENGHRVELTTDERGNVLSRTTCRGVNSCNTNYSTYLKSTDPLDPRRDRVASTSDARSSGPDDTRYRTTFEYDAAGRPTRTTSPVPDGSSSAPTGVTAFSTGTENADGGGKVPAGLPIRLTGVRDQVTTFAYRSNGDLAESVAPAGLRTRHTYDGIGRPKTTTTLNAGGVAFGVTAYEYTPRSQIAKITEPAVTNPITGVRHTRVTTNRYDGNGNPLETKVSDLTATTAGGDAARTTTFGYDANDRLASTTFPDGGVETRAYLDNGLTEVVKDVGGTTWTTQSDEFGRLLALSAGGKDVDPEDPRATALAVEYRTYDPAGRLSSSTDAMGRTTDYRYFDDGLPASATLRGCLTPGGPCDVVMDARSYDPAGNLVEQVAGGGRKTTQVFDPAGFVTSSTFDPDGLNRKLVYRRDADGNPTRIERRGSADPARVEASDYQYDPESRVVREDAYLDASTTLSTSIDRDERGLVRNSTDRRQLTTSYDYDATGGLVRTVRPKTDAWVGGVRTTAFAREEVVGRNAFGEVSHSRDGSGAVTTTEHDPMGRLSVGTLPAYTPPGGTPITATTRTEYDKSGNPIRTTDSLNRVTVNTFDPYGRVLTTTLPQVGDTPSVLRFRYDRLGELRSQADPSGAETLFTYDELGRRITETQTDRWSGTTAFYTTNTAYDVAGNAKSVTTPQGFTSVATHDKAGEVLTATDATNRTTSYTYDNVGRVATSTDPAGLTTVNGYDLLGRQTGVAHDSGGRRLRAWATGYDANGNVATKTTPEGRGTTYQYDELDRLVQQTERVGPTKSINTLFGYDKLGNRSRFVDGNGRVTTYTSTSWGLPESVVEPATAATPNAVDRTWTTSYDAASQPVKVAKPGGVVRTLEHDEQGRLKVEKGTGAESATPDRTLGYDPAGRVTRVSGPNGDSTYRYDDRGLLRESHGAAGESTLSYNGDGTLSSRTDVSGTAAFTYDGAGRTTSVVDSLTGRTVDYGYDGAGRTALVSDRTVSATVNRRMSYDDLGRPATDQVQQVVDAGLPPRVVIGTDYGYDLDDKQTSKKTTSTAGTAANSYGYDGAGRLASWTDTTGKVTAYGWDDAGNRTSAGDQVFSYDEANRLASGDGATYTYTKRGTQASVTRGGQTTRSESDAFDRTTVNGIGRYSYDALDRVSDRNGARFAYAGTTNEAVSDGGRVVSRLPSGEAFSDKASGGAGRMLYADRHGDVVGRYLGGSAAGLRTFDPFGKVTGSASDASSLGYQGDWTDQDTGDVNMTARWYSPGVGRFTSRDDWTLNPLPSAAGNRYQYADDDPVNGADPSGHCFWDACILEGIAVGEALIFIGTVAVGSAAGISAIDWAMEDAPATTVTGTTTAGRWSCAVGGCRSRCPDGVCGRTPPPRVNPVQACAGGSCLRPTCTVSCGGGVVRPPAQPAPPLPPPPPQWLVNALTTMVRPAAGSTVGAIATDVLALTAATVVTDLSAERVEEATEVSEADPENQPRPPGVALPDEDGDDCYGLEPNTPVYSPMEPVDYQVKYRGKPRTGATRATGAKVCLTGINDKARLTPLQPAGEQSSTELVRGHLVAHMFYGSNKRDNMVPLWDKTNNPDMLSIEYEVKRHVEAGETVHYEVIPLFEDDKNPIPYAVHIEALGNRGWNCSVIIVNTQQRTGQRGGC
ncbi:MAG: RHS repeat-associated core domain-containing protein, partial [Umezawaea sp.]